jgi:hypothetical protein
VRGKRERDMNKDRDRDRERRKESGRWHRAISRRVYYVETAGRDVANGEIVSCTGTHSPVHASGTCVQVTRVYCHGGVQ